MGYVVGFFGGGDWFQFVFSLHTGLVHFLTPTLVARTLLSNFANEYLPLWYRDVKQNIH